MSTLTVPSPAMFAQNAAEKQAAKARYAAAKKEAARLGALLKTTGNPRIAAEFRRRLKAARDTMRANKWAVSPKDC